MAKTIVVVEDFNSSRSIIKHTLEKKGFSVLDAEDGRDAMKFFDGRKIDLVITDYNMPNMDGGKLVEYIRNITTYLFIPILVLSTETSREKQEEVMKSNITGWVKKPFQVDTFLKIVDRALKA